MKHVHKPKLLLKDKGIINRYPRTFFTIFTTSALLMFFSKPIYDIFTFDPKFVDVEELKRQRAIKYSKD